MNPYPGQELIISGKPYIFENYPHGMLRFEVGRKGRVYRLRSATGQLFALKVFFDFYRYLSNYPEMTIFRSIPGFRVSDRYIISAQNEKELIGKYPDLDKAILMPYIDGISWGNMIASGKVIDFKQSIHLAKSLSKILFELENKRLAHCDISSDNLIISRDFTGLEFIDIEEAYWAERIPPKHPPLGTEGYSPEVILENGYYGVLADRFAAGVLITEILCWQYLEIVQQREANSLFASGEFGLNSKRFKLVGQKLKELPATCGINPEGIYKLFDQLWFATGDDINTNKKIDSPENILERCPKIAEWKSALGE